MAKMITDKEMGQIIYDATHKLEMIECADAYQHFLEGLADLVAEHFGADRGSVSPPMINDECDGWMAAFYPNESTPDDGWVFADYDTDISIEEWMEERR